MDRFEELLAENEGDDSPEMEREAEQREVERELAKISMLQQIETEMVQDCIAQNFPQMSMDEAVADFEAFHGPYTVSG